MRHISGRELLPSCLGDSSCQYRNIFCKGHVDITVHVRVCWAHQSCTKCVGNFTSQRWDSSLRSIEDHDPAWFVPRNVLTTLLQRRVTPSPRFLPLSNCNAAGAGGHACADALRRHSSVNEESPDPGARLSQSRESKPQ